MSTRVPLLTSGATKNDDHGDASTKRGYSQRLLRPSLYRPLKEPTEAFHVTVFKVGGTIFVFCSALYLVSVSVFTRQRNDVPYREYLLVKHADAFQESKKDPKVNFLPSFSLSQKSEHDAFAKQQELMSKVTDGDKTPKFIQQFLVEAEKLQNQFADRYGGELSAKSLVREESCRAQER